MLAIVKSFKQAELIVLIYLINGDKFLILILYCYKILFLIDVDDIFAIKGVRIVRNCNYLVLNVLVYNQVISQKSITSVLVVKLAFCCWVVKRNISIKVPLTCRVEMQKVIVSQGLVK
jgi:hypothetical protein